MLFRPNATEFNSLKFSPSTREFVPSNAKGFMLSAGAREFVPSPLAKELRPSPNALHVHQKSSLAVNSAPGSAKRFQPRPTADNHFCYATFTYYSCGCRIKEPFLFCKPNFHARSTNNPVTPGFNPCQHERVSIVVGCMPSACKGLHGISAACMARDPAAECFTREIDTANRFIVHFTLGNCRGLELQAAVPLKTNGGPSTLEDEVRQHYRRWQDPRAPRLVSNEIPVGKGSEETIPQDSEPVAQGNQEREQEVQRNTEVEEAPENQKEAFEDDEGLVEEKEEGEIPGSEDEEEQEAAGATLRGLSAETDSESEDEGALIDSESIGFNEEPEEPVSEVEEPAIEQEFAFESEELDVEPEESMFKPEEPVFEPEPSVEPEEFAIEPKEPVFKLEELVFEAKKPTVEPEFAYKSEELETEPEETTAGPDPVAESEDPLLELERLMLEFQKPTHEEIEFEEYPEVPEYEPEESDDELSDVELQSPLYEPEVSGAKLAGPEEPEGKIEEDTEDYAAQYSASSGPIDYGFDAYDGYDGSDNSDDSGDSDSDDSDDSDGSDSEDSDSEDSDSGGARTDSGQSNDRTASDMLDFLESCETIPHPETKPAKRFWSKLSFRVW
ncbi:hypothetical protein F4775DRAFT_580537 [Biscogniauxia sp. FL1348]|nr:hypothetical protein F4775DRAFT_580537 [Biscogniauxia sp. FL1348]